MGFKLTVLVVVMTVGGALAAPKPVDWDEVGRKINNFGQQALPYIRGVCGFANSYTGYPQGVPQYPGYSQGGYQGYSPYYPVPQGNMPVFSNTPFNSGLAPPQGVLEQDGLNRPNSLGSSAQPPPPQLQDILNRIDKLPKLKIVPGNALEEEQFNRKYKGRF